MNPLTTPDRFVNPFAPASGQGGQVNQGTGMYTGQDGKLYKEGEGPQVSWNSAGISSSGMAIDSSRTSTAVNNAGNALSSGSQSAQTYTGPDGRTYSSLTGNPVSNSGYTPGSATIGGATNQFLTPEQIADQSASMAAKAFAPIDALYNQQLGNQNSAYANAMQQLKEQTELQHNAWDFTAAKLNPYSDKTTSTNIGAHHEYITNKSTALAADLTQKAQEAQTALQMGRVKDYMALQSQMSSSIQNYQKEITGERWKQMQFLQTQQQNDTSNRNVSADNFRELLSKSLPSSEEMSKMIQSGEIQKSPLYQEALKAGYDTAGALSLIQSAAKAQEDKTGMEWAKFRLQLDREERLSTQQNAAQIQAAVINAVSSVPRPTGSSATPEAMADYYKNIALKTGGGKTDFRIAQDFSNLQTVMGSVGNLKEAIKGLTNTDPLLNIISSKLPWSEKNANLEAWANVNAAPLARLFGEKGTLAEGDVSRLKSFIGTGGTPSEVREKLFNGLVNIIQDKFYNNLEGYANQGYNVSAYAKDIDQVQDFAKNTQIAPQGSIAVPKDVQSIFDKYK